jgi:PKHD-type hydroxylase
MEQKKLTDQTAHLLCATERIFSNEEIDRIIEQGKKLQFEEAVVNGQDGKFGVKAQTRTCKIGWFMPGADTNWIFDRIIDVITTVNNSHFRFDLTQFEPLQFASYDSSREEFYGQHMDCTMGIPHKTASRKLSITIQLSGADEYQGGDLNLYQGRDPIVAPKGKGQLVCFPSYVLHEVTPVTSGTRYSLVTWVHGPLFR